MRIEKEADGRFRKGADIQRRAFLFGCTIVELNDQLAVRGSSAREIGRQLLRAATSVGANLEEADAAQSRSDFISKCNIALKEARESLYWLRLLTATNKLAPAELELELERDCNELVSILTVIVKKSREHS